MAVDNNAYFRIVWQFSSSEENGKPPKQVVTLERSRVREEWLSEQNLVVYEKKAEGKHIVFFVLQISGEHLLCHHDLSIWQRGHFVKQKWPLLQMWEANQILVNPKSL